MIRCEYCGAACDPSDIRQGLCDDCRSPETEFRPIKRENVYVRNRKSVEAAERSLGWRHCLT